jgi:hypothetical protein
MRILRPGSRARISATPNALAAEKIKRELLTIEILAGLRVVRRSVA